MKRNNKFSIGASVHLVFATGGEGKNKRKARYHVHDDIFMVNRVSKDEEGYHYSLMSGHEDIIDWCYEENVFASLDDARKEVDKRNKTLMEAENA